MKTSNQEAFAAAVLEATKPSSSAILELFNLVDITGGREYKSVPENYLVTVLCEIITKASVTEVSCGIEFSEDGSEWYPAQTAEKSDDKLVLTDDVVTKTVASSGDRWEFSFETPAPFVRILPWASAGSPVGSSFTAKAMIAKVNS